MTNRLKVYYTYRCTRCGRVQHRGSSAAYCDGSHPLVPKCRGRLVRMGRKAHTRPPRLA